jgi:type I restriction-modification system DNA methylase subunit
MINPLFSSAFKEEDFTEFVQGIIPGIILSRKLPELRNGFKSIQQIAEAKDNKLDLVVFIAKPDASFHARIEIIKNTYAILKNHARSNALVAYISDDNQEWRLSLVTTKVTRTKDGVKESVSDPRRFSYVLGPSAKVVTPSKMLQGAVTSINDLKSMFSLSVVSKEFYTKIATQYSKLIGGVRGEGNRAIAFKRTLEIGSTNDDINANFAIRLIGRLVFCWFLKQKKGNQNSPLIPSEILSTEAVNTIGDYYHTICVPLFFEVLNKPQSSRPPFISYKEYFDKVPFLNGGLFQDHVEDNHKFNRITGMSERRGVVKVPDLWLFELFQIFEEYNFTIDENTSIDTELSIDPEMLGRIFENLLAEVNPETGASARKSTGSFYTPREIVDFMVNESLIEHLRTKTNISEEKIRAVSSYDLDDDELHSVDPQERKLLVEVIHNTTVLDPACGSGAFPIGTLQRLVHMLEVLDPECSIYLSKIPPEMRRQLQKHSRTYVRKLGVIRECIHGVDIQPIAIDISRLRCFLTLVVDQQVDDDEKNRGIEPLPNLDFKFVCANTLIKPPVYDSPLFGDEFANALGELIDEYFAPVDLLHKLETARKLQKLISDKTKKELENILKSYSYVKDENTKKALAQKNEKSDTERMRINDLWGSYENIFQSKPVGFFDIRYFFPMVFRNGGFDIVIGNPPYVRVQEINRDISENYNNTYVSAQGSYDLYMLFTERALGLISKEGIVNFIMPHKWLNSSAGKGLRRVVKNNISKIISFKEYQVFNATTYTSLVWFSAVNVTLKYLGLAHDLTTNSELAEFLDTIKECDYSLFKNNVLNESPWSFSEENISKVLEKIKQQPYTVEDIFEKIFQGLKTGFDDIYIIDNCKASKNNLIIGYSNELNKEVQIESSFIRPLLKGKDIHKYEVLSPNKAVIFPYYRSSDNGIEKINLYTESEISLLFPLGYSYLKMFESQLRDREHGRFNVDGKWFQYSRNQGISDTEKEKIMLSELSYGSNMTIDTQGIYHVGQYSMIKGEDIKESYEYYLSILNSNLMWFFIKNTGSIMRGGYFAYRPDYLKPFPLPRVMNKKDIEVLESLVCQILTLKKKEKDADTKKLELQIDQLVYKLYNLTSEEINIVENSTMK